MEKEKNVKEAVKEPEKKKTKKSTTAKTKTAKTKEKAPETPLVEEEVAAVAEQKPEEKVLIMACLNPSVKKVAAEYASANGVEVVALDDKVIFDYLKERGEKRSNIDAISQFLGNERNRKMAKEHQMKLWNILTRNAPIELEKKYPVFTRTMVVKLTTMSHSQATDVLAMLSAFGYVEFTDKIGNKGGKGFEFRFVFDEQDIVDNLKNELECDISVVAAQYLKYECAAVNKDGTDKDKILEQFIEDLKKSIRG
jgi:hypothetical protein